MVKTVTPGALLLGMMMLIIPRQLTGLIASSGVLDTDKIYVVTTGSPSFPTSSHCLRLSNAATTRKCRWHSKHAYLTSKRPCQLCEPMGCTIQACEIMIRDTLSSQQLNASIEHFSNSHGNTISEVSPGSHRASTRHRHYTSSSLRSMASPWQRTIEVEMTLTQSVHSRSCIQYPYSPSTL